MDFYSVIKLLGGLGLFLYGIYAMGDGLEKTAGSKLERTLESWTGTVFKGILVGLVVTAVIQSSSATTVMVVGFVNAGMMKLRQAAGVIMGANIGTTITAHLIALSGLSSDNPVLSFFTPTSLAPLIIFLAVVATFVFKSKKAKNVSFIFLGFGILFLGMGIMDSVLKPLAELPAFRNAFITFSDIPILGVGVGALVTAIIQSSSASVGILQSISSTGALSFAAAVPIILGQNIGTCITAILSSIGTKKNARRAAAIHFYFNFIGTILFMSLIYAYNSIIGFSFWDSAITRSAIANVHTVFNLFNTIIFVPFVGFLVWLAKITIRDKKSDRKEFTFSLEERFLATPSIAIEQSKKIIVDMAEKVKENFEAVFSLFNKYDRKLLEDFYENENIIDRIETNVGNYLIKISQQELDENNRNVLNLLLHTSCDFERVGDNLENIAQSVEKLKDEGLCITDKGIFEVNIMFEAVREILDITVNAYLNNDLGFAERVEPLEETVDLLKQTLKSKHVDRLQDGKCSIASGVIFLDIINNLERVADHCSSIAIHVIQYKTKPGFINTHEYFREMHISENDEYKSYKKYFEDKYYSPIA